MEDDLILPKQLGSCGWPVLVALDAPSLCAFCQHDDGGAFVLPDHAPKVFGGVWEGPLCCYVGIAVMETLG